MQLKPGRCSKFTVSSSNQVYLLPNSLLSAILDYGVCRDMTLNKAIMHMLKLMWKTIIFFQSRPLFSKRPINLISLSLSSKVESNCRADFRLASSQWEMLQNNALSHWPVSPELLSTLGVFLSTFAPRQQYDFTGKNYICIFQNILSLILLNDYFLWVFFN